MSFIATAHNTAIKLSVHPVTPLAQDASVAPVWPAAYRVR
jgi:hypothetical protein